MSVLDWNPVQEQGLGSSRDLDLTTTAKSRFDVWFTAIDGVVWWWAEEGGVTRALSVEVRDANPLRRDVLKTVMAGRSLRGWALYHQLSDAIREAINFNLGVSETSAIRETADA